MLTHTQRRISTLLSLFLLLAAMPWSADAQGADEDSIGQGRAILITGASTGIGRYTAELLAREGFYIYAGARKEKDLAELDAIENIEAIRLDVTKPDEIAAAVETVRAGGRGLHGLINNAGVLVLAPMVELSEDDLDFQFDVNVYGPYRVTKAFAPLLIESKGRVSTTSSISGFVTFRFGGPYTMSKHAIEAYSDVLAAEMEPLGVRVSVVEPGNYNSRIATSMYDRMVERGYSAEGSLFEAQLKGLLSRPLDRTQYKEPHEVAEAFLHAMSDENPKRRYLVVPNEREARVTLRNTMNRIVQLNRDQPFELTREQLIEMLDEVLENEQE